MVVGDPVLTQRELDVLNLVAEGFTNYAIARELSLAEKTVENLLSATYAKIGVRNRAQAAVWYAGYERREADNVWLDCFADFPKTLHRLRIEGNPQLAAEMGLNFCTQLEAEIAVGFHSL